ncbi:DUF429 domain-containing protein [Rhizobium straminoryzae]|uniref:DUF429 domain-containing protein n=1 Tax=Rhizobium straminoryzae TaxID=1387186 RepID=A0A549TBJ1_9HYPH|nr:DUF429 domain-containing protein [Rhizobium straminoryzae]TRL39180.1 DUF429 domain-containing protein [Rhizobium straminoryzae]
MLPAIIAHCDWSIDARKRWMAVAIREGGGYRLAAPEPVGNTADLIERLATRATEAGPLLLGFDFPIGLPVSYGALTGLASFRHFLDVAGEGEWAHWFRVAAKPEEIAVSRPFYPARPGGTLRSHLFTGLGLDAADLLRQCERPAPGRATPAMLFWTLGGNQVGKAAITGWREIILPNRNRIGLWPFDGALFRILAEKAIVIAETYPGDAYGQIGIARQPVWSKRKHEGRLRAAGFLHRWIADHLAVDASALLPSLADGFGVDAAGEDRFDCTVGLLAMIDVVFGARPEGAPLQAPVTTWEGWILGRA